MVNLSKIIKFIGPFFGYRAAHFLTRSYPRILMYHRFSEEGKRGHVSKNMLEYQLDLLLQNTEVVPLSELVLNHNNMDYIKKRKRPISVITIDDGYRDFYEVLYPLLKERSLPATFFVATGFIDGTNWLWHDKLKWCIENKPENITCFSWAGNYLEFSESESVDHIWKVLVSRLLQYDGVTIDYRIKELAQTFGITIPEIPPKEYAPVTWSEIREMATNDIEIGGHTENHYSLGRLPESEVEKELIKCSERIEKEIGKKPISFCFPNGQPQDIPNRIMENFSKTSFEGATVAFYDCHGISDRYQLRRHGVGEDWFAFKKSVYGVDWIGARFLNRDSKFDWRS